MQNVVSLNDEEKFISPSQIAKALAVAPSTVYGWFEAGILKKYKIGGCVRVKLSDYKRFVEGV